MTETLTIQLDNPIEWAKGTYSSLTLREPMAGEVRKAEGQMRNGANVEAFRLYNMHLLAAVSGWPLPAIELLPISVLNRAADHLADFINPGPKTGET